MRFVKRLIVLLIVLVVLIVGVAFVLPAKSAASRSVVIERPPSLVYAVIDGFGRFNEWSPWYGIDPNATYTLSGPAHGVGAKMSWVSEHREVGTGSQTITAVEPNKSVDTALDFGPMGQPRARLLLEPEGSGTRVTWSFDADLPLQLDGTFHYGVIGRYMGLMMPNMVGGKYEQGLAKLKTLVETLPNTDIAGLEASAKEVQASPAYEVAGKSAIDAAASAQVLGAAYGEIGALLAANGINMAGPPYTVVHSASATEWSFDAGIPVDRNDAAPTGDIKATQTYAGKVIEFKHVGPYDGLPLTHAKIDAWLAANALKPSGPQREIYVSDPGNTAAAELVTLIHVPVP